MRVFTAIPLPESVKQQLTTVMTSPIPFVKWEQPDDLHITLRFIGEVNEDTLERYAEALKTIQAFPFDITLHGVGKFPNEKPLDLRVLLVTLAPSRRLKSLQLAVSTALEAEGLPKDKYDSYIPHVTIARVKADPHARILPPLKKFLDQHAALNIGPIPLTDFVMYETARQPNGAQYREVMRFPLEG